MRRLLVVALLLAGCASGSRPVKQLDDLGVMVGGAFNGPGVEFDPELTAWLRFAPIRYVDVTVGGTVTVPLFENAAFGGLAELRAHLPMGTMRLVLDATGELMRYKLTERTSVNVHRLTFAPLLVYEGSRLTPYVGPKLMYLSHMDLDGTSLDASPGLRANGEGAILLGGIVGLEGDVGVFVAGGSLSFGALMNGQDVNEAQSLAFTMSLYLGY